jgi:type IV fimbrial biogenesis protein FimT
VLNRATLARGFTLIELAIVLAVIGVVLALGAPGFSAWIQNTQIRSATDSMLTGIKLARAEALKQNTVVRFQLMTSTDASCGLSTSGTNWVVSVSDATNLCNVTDPSAAPLIVRIKPSDEGTSNVVYSASQSCIAFDSLGRVITTPVPGCIPAGDVAIDITNPAGGACVTASGPMRCLRIDVTPGGQARMCDPAVTTATDPRSC